MDRIASLRLAARDLRARIFSSLPFVERVAHVIVTGSSLGAGLDKVFSDLFKKAGIPVDDSVRGFGERLYRIMVAKYRDAEFVTDMIMEFVADRALTGSIPFDTTYGSREAMNLVITAVNNFIIDKLRVVQRRKKLAPTGPMERPDNSGEMTTIDFDDPRARHEFDKLVTGELERKIKKEIGKILPWAPQWFDLVLQGFKDTEIIGDPAKKKPSSLAEEMGLDPPYLMAPSGKPMTIPMWSNNYKPKIMDKIKEIFAKS